MKRILPAETPGGFDFGPRRAPVAVHEMPRFEVDGAAVSASKVRDLIRGGRLPEAERLVPRTTWKWLTSEEALPVMERIRNSDRTYCVYTILRWKEALASSPQAQLNQDVPLRHAPGRRTAWNMSLRHRIQQFGKESVGD